MLLPSLVLLAVLFVALFILPAVLVPDTAEVELGKIVTNTTAASDVKYHLYTNNLTPVEGTVLADFTECTDALYAAIAVAGANWTWSTVAGTSFGTAPNITFSFAAAVSIYGYFVTNNAGTKLLWCERFGGAPISYGSLDRKSVV